MRRRILVEVVFDPERGAPMLEVLNGLCEKLSEYVARKVIRDYGVKLEAAGTWFVALTAAEPSEGRVGEVRQLQREESY